MKNPTTQQLADFFGVHKNTIQNWEKPLEQKSETGETCKFFPPQGRHHLAKAARLYYYLKEKDEDGISNAEYYANTLKGILDAVEFLQKDGSFEIDGEEKLFSEIGKQMLKKSIKEIEETKSLFLFL